MGLKDKWAQKERALADRQAAEPAVSPAEVTKQKATSDDKTPQGPGAGQNSTHGAVTYGKMAMLEHEVKELRAGAPRLMLDPTLVHPSRWANRHELSFSSADFKELKNEIGSAGKNVQPIKVRPLGGRPGNFEIVFGHRRHRACLELGIKVEAIVEALDDQALFAEMDRENRLRSDLRPFEQGVMYQKALDEGLFPSLRQLSEKLGVDVSAVSKAKDIASLPSHVLEAFSSPLAIQFRWASVLKAALVKDPDGVAARAADIAVRKTLRPVSDVDVLTVLSGEVKALSSEKCTLIKGKGVSNAIYRKSNKGHVFEIPAAGISAEQIKQVRDLIASLLT
jgi:ParB family chromosome partitioning protein